MAGSKPRLVWFDANRVCAALGVVLIHCTSDFSGKVFPTATPDERAVPVLLRSVAEFSSSEMFFFSLFLMAMRVDRNRPTYGSAMATQAERLLVPFAFWTVFYAFFRLVKAEAFGYTSDVLEQLGQWQTWGGFFVLGKAQYHLHFLPTLFLLFLFFFPVMRLGMRYPILGLTLLATLGVMNSVQGWLWSLEVDPGLRDYLIRGVKVLGYVGYGFAALALYGIWKDGIPRGESRLIRRGGLFSAAMAYLATLPFFGSALLSGAWGMRSDWAFYGHFLMPVFVFGVFLGGQYANWSPHWSQLAQFTFGIYLTHPLLIDLFDVAIVTSGAASIMSPTAVVVVRYGVVMPSAFLLSMGIARVKFVAWTIGLGPTPWTWGRTPALVASQV